MDVIRVLEGGISTTVQDLGRYGYQRYGVPVSGAMDPFALRVANLLVGNPEGDAGLEFTLAGARLEFLADTVAAITGADLDPRLDGRPLPMWRAVAAPAGGVLSFDEARDGVRAYLAVAGGIAVPVVLGSRSTYTRARLGGVEGRRLEGGDRLPWSSQEPADRVECRVFSHEGITGYGHSHPLRVVLGPQQHAFTREGIETFLSSTYTVTPMSDRIGCRLDGPTVGHVGAADIISDGVPWGAVQVTGDGKPIVLLADRGTTGGYTKIATVISADLPALAQATPGDMVSFHSVDVEEAHRALKEQEELINGVRNWPAIVFTTRRYRARVDGRQHEVEGGLGETGDGMPSAGTQSRTLRVILGGKSYTFNVEVEAAEGP